MKIKEIPFSSLKDYNDSNSIVALALILKEEEVEEMNDFFHQYGLLPNTLNISGVCHLCDNVKGDDGRSDYLIELSGSGSVNPLARLMFCRNGFHISWTSDFIVNYHKDYVSGI